MKPVPVRTDPVGPEHQRVVYSDNSVQFIHNSGLPVSPVLQLPDYLRSTYDISPGAVPSQTTYAGAQPFRQPPQNYAPAFDGGGSAVGLSLASASIGGSAAKIAGGGVPGTVGLLNTRSVGELSGAMGPVPEALGTAAGAILRMPSNPSAGIAGLKGAASKLFLHDLPTDPVGTIMSALFLHPAMHAASDAGVAGAVGIARNSLARVIADPKTALAVRAEAVQAYSNLRGAQSVGQVTEAVRQLQQTTPEQAQGRQVDMSSRNAAQQSAHTSYEFNPPVADLPLNTGKKTSGVLHLSMDKQSKLVSGINGPSYVLRRNNMPGFNSIQLTHVEGHAATLMRINNVRYAVLDINKVPCVKGRGGGCEGLLPRMLPPGAVLRVRGPNGYDRPFKGLPDKLSKGRKRK